MKRRTFIQFSAFASLGLSLTAIDLLHAENADLDIDSSSEYKTLIFNLLKDWCDGLIRIQVIDPSNPRRHGQFDCPACEHIHARIMDTVYPFFYMANATGDKKYFDAGVAAFEWGENVSRDDGAWTNDFDPNSWDATTVFGAVALAEALKYHSNLLDPQTKKRWYSRLEKATAFVYQRLNVIGNANINYGATAIYALNLIGKLLNEPVYIARSKELAAQIRRHFTEPNHFISGEIRGKDKWRRSAKGLLGIDLGYNLEESLNSLVLYALEENDEELLALVKKSLDTHLEFILPDGGIDNGFGTRMFKWTYWGSRTSDGVQPAFSMMAGYNPALGTAAVKNTELLKRCTHNGLLHGGPHYVSHEVKPCVHHTFTHAKPLAAMLDHWQALPHIDTSAPLPSAVLEGHQYFEELDVSLFGKGDWRGTISAYDAIYSPDDDVRQGTGASLCSLYHNKVGLLCSASMAIYKKLEANNQQDQPGEDFALTPRIETHEKNDWFTNLFDLAATFDTTEKNKQLTYTAKVKLKNKHWKTAPTTASVFELRYDCSDSVFTISAETDHDITAPTYLVVPLVSPRHEEVKQISERLITINKSDGLVSIKSNTNIKIKKTKKNRVFNMVPGVEAVPILVKFQPGKKRVSLSIEIS